MAHHLHDSVGILVEVARHRLKVGHDPGLQRRAVDREQDVLRQRHHQPRAVALLGRQVEESPGPIRIEGNGGSVTVTGVSMDSNQGDVGLARDTGADGVHLQSDQLMQCRTRPANGLLAVSCHNREELLRAAELGADLAVLSPVLPTQSHPGAETLGWERFAELCLDMPMPVYALGGMETGMIEQSQRQGGQGIAAIRALWGG